MARKFGEQEWNPVLHEGTLVCGLHSQDGPAAMPCRRPGHRALPQPTRSSEPRLPRLLPEGRPEPGHGDSGKSAFDTFKVCICIGSESRFLIHFPILLPTSSPAVRHGGSGC